MKKSNIKIVFTDLDGTLLRQDRQIGGRDLNTLHKLGKAGINRVLATGRSLFSLRRVLPDDFPIDYVVFSCGVGCMDWRKKEILTSNTLPKKQVQKIIATLIEQEIDFMVHKPVPDNHHFHYHRARESNPDFDRRLSFYADYGTPLKVNAVYSCDASQALAILSDEGQFYQICEKLRNVRVIRTTSPLDHTSIWVEIFPEHVSKGHAAEWLCDHLSIPRNSSIGIGNDYNDIELLEWTHYSFVVDNAPQELRDRFNATSSNQCHGFSEVIYRKVFHYDE
ncbi:MAG TPA: HAD family phosphatase [Candidatus Cloacimonetes bacterium]|nr:HAD family phosphatase [Candidatus Cloacimonadota bacterium]HEX38028.1 HAD family phosphatase [Candidatus Cloacimonadota bacterium]